MSQLTLEQRDKIGQIKWTKQVIEERSKRVLVLTEMLEEASDDLLTFQILLRELTHGD